MHEAGLLTAAVAALAEATEGRAVRDVTLAIGPRVDRGAAEQAWTAAVAGGPLAAARVEWMAAQDVVRCLSCATEYAGSPLMPCPSCGGDGLVVHEAHELVIVDWTA